MAETSPFRHADKTDQSFAVLAQQFLVDARLVIETFEIAFRNQLDEILVSLLVLAKNDQVIRPAARRIAIEPIRLRDVHLAADDRFDAGLLRGFIEADRAEQIAMIGNGDRRHLVFCRRLGQRVVIARAIEQAETGVQVKMNKLRHRT